MSEEATQVEGEVVPEDVREDVNAEVEETEATAESEQVDSDEEATASDEPKKSGVQKRIDELTREKYEERRERERLATEKAAIERQLQELTRQSTQSNWQSQRPTLEQFNYDEQAFNAAYDQWYSEGQQRQQEESRKQQEAQQKQIEAYRFQQELVGKVQAAEAKYPGFSQRIQDPSLPPLGQISPTAYQAVINSPQFEDVAWHLANNPSEIYKFQNMSPIDAVKEVARLEVRLSRPRQSNPPPKPPSEVSARNKAQVNPDEMSMDEWLKWRES